MKRLNLIRVLGRLSNERGHATEERALRAVRDIAASWPEWLRRVEVASPEEDARGWDLVAHTDVGKIGIQIKSSKLQAERFRARHPGILVVVAKHQTPESVLAKLVVKAFENTRAVFLEVRAERGGAA